MYVSDFFEEHPKISTRLPTRRPRAEAIGRSDQRRKTGRRDRAPEERLRKRSELRLVEEPEARRLSKGARTGRPASRPSEQVEAGDGENDRGFVEATGGDDAREGGARKAGIFRRASMRSLLLQDRRLSTLKRTRRAVFQGTEPSDVMPSDVIVLPGESLAKYRGVRTAPQESRAAGETAKKTLTHGNRCRLKISRTQAPISFMEHGTTGQHARDLRYDDFAIHVVSELDDEAMDAAEARAEEIAEIVESQHAALENDQMPAGEMEIEFVTEQTEDEFAVLVLESESEPAADQGGADAEESASNEDAEAAGGNEGGETPEPPSAGPLSEAAATRGKP